MPGRKWLNVRQGHAPSASLHGTRTVKRQIDIKATTAAKKIALKRMSSHAGHVHGRNTKLFYELPIRSMKKKLKRNERENAWFSIRLKRPSPWTLKEGRGREEQRECNAKMPNRM